MTTQYELLYIIPATYTDEDLGGVENTVKALLEKHGATIDSMTRLGKFRFAYAINNARYGHYVLVRFSAEGSAIKAIDGALRIATEVLRHLILRADEAGGTKFDLVQFTEVNLDTKESRDDRHRDGRRAAPKAAEEIKTGVAAIEEGAKTDEKAAMPELSAEELEKKIDAALEEKA
jgi:small subunit ribosomal protein S6